MDELPSLELHQYLSDQRRELVTFLSTLTRFESPSLDPDSQAPVFEFLGGALEDLGFNLELLPGVESGGHLLAHWPLQDGARPSQLLLGHSDTVWPHGTLQQMPVRVNGNRLHGPGVFDMKSGLAQMVFALKALKALGLTPVVAPRIFVNSDEEIGSRESTEHIIRLARSANRVLVLEPSLGPQGKLKTARKGVGRFTVEVQGISAHAGLEPEKGSSAILELSYQIQQLFALNQPERGITVNVGMIEGGMRPNVVAPSSRAEVDVRVPTLEAAAEVEAAIRSLRPRDSANTLVIEGQINRPPLEQTPSNRALWELARDLGAGLNLKLDQATAGGASDGNTTSQFAPTLDGLGGVGDGAHARHEFVYIHKLVERSALLALLLLAPALDG